MKNQILALGFALLFLVGGYSVVAACDGIKGSVNGHPISVVEANIYVNRFKTTMTLTCFADDLTLLQGVEPLDNGKYDSDELIDATQDHAKYLAKNVTLRDANGALMKPRIVEVIDMVIPEDGIMTGGLMNFTLGVVIEFRYDEPPEFITIEQNMVADGALLPSDLTILLKQAGVELPRQQGKAIKPGEPLTIRFDWDSPNFTLESTDEELETWFDKQREKSLGITSYSSIYSFIYITNHEVRHEILIPLATLTTLLEIERADPSFLDVTEQAAAAKKIESYFKIGNPLMIDGIEVNPVFDRIDFYGLDLRDFAVRAEKRRVSMASGRVGIIMSYSTQGPPTTVEVVWDRFNDVIKSVDAVVFAHDKIEKTRFSRFLEDNTYRWDAPDRKPLPPITGIATTLDGDTLASATFHLPIASSILILIGLISAAGALVVGGSRWKWVLTGAVCIGVSVLTWGIWQVEMPVPFAARPKFEIEDEDAGLVFAQLHKNMFRAFDYRHESDVYDALEKSVDGELLREIYLDVNRSLSVAEQGGAVAKIEEVTLLEGEHFELPFDSEDHSPGFGYRSKWIIRGTIEHWAHIHERKIGYEAIFQIRLRDHAWKITSREVIDEDPGMVSDRPRKYWEDDANELPETQPKDESKGGSELPKR